MSRLQKKKPSAEKKKKSGGSPDKPPEKMQAAVGAKPAATVSAGKPKIEKASAAAPIGEPNSIQKAMAFFREVKVELKKVTWPTRKQTTGTTIVVIIFVFIVAAFLGLFDYSLSKLVQVVLT